jgi:hypothetical protein
MELAEEVPGRSGQKGSPLFAWADGTCNDFKPGLSATAPRRR